MDTIPQMISTKDLAYLSDMFEWNYHAFKQINHYLGEVEEEKIKDLLEDFKNMHHDHMEFIISILRKEEYEECEDCECEECDCDDCGDFEEDEEVEEDEEEDEDEEIEEDFEEEEEDE